MSTLLDSPAVTAPPRSITQRRDALKRANHVRTSRAVLKRDLKAGRRQVVPLLLDPPEWLLTMKVAELLLAVPKVGRVKVGRAMHMAGCSPSKSVGGLSDRQRRMLVSLLRGGT